MNVVCYYVRKKGEIVTKSTKGQIYCFLDSARPCTLNCRAAYKGGRETYCRIIWGIQQVGYMICEAEEKVKKETKKSKKK